MRLLRQGFLLLILVIFSTAAAQNETCTAIIQEALAVVGEACAATGRNQACYGNIQLAATPRDGAPAFTFEQPGDVVNIADVETLRLSALDTDESSWGVALMQLQANLPDTLPGQNVTFLLFGDVEIENAVEPSAPLPTLEAISTGSINVRIGPSTEAGIAGSLASGETVTVNGRNADASWLRIIIPDSGSLGWVRADLVTAEGDVNSLEVVEADDLEIPFTPMQAFYFRTGIIGTTCAEAPQDGILIQTPEGAGEITLRANDVDIRLGSTAYLRAQPGETMSVSVLEGQGAVTADGSTVIVPEGAWTEIPITDDLTPTGAPGEPQPYDDDTLETLPIEVLPREIVIAPPADEAALAEGGTSGGGTGGSGLVGVVPGFDPSMLGGMDLATFCAIMDQSLAEAGMSRAEYLALLQQIRGMVPAADAADFDQFIALLSACP
ncbi:MAG: SH3 domain-containing protein [Chloroflexota bacterium]|nr:SH3 domain-containing protein [Chloroflexota bacterium]